MQDTKLVYYKGLLVVAIVLKNEITQLKQVRSYFTDESRILYDLDYIYSLTETLKSKIDIERFKEHIRKLVLVSYVFCNVDLHPGNIGFNKINGKYEPSEIYDLGGSFLSAYAEDIDKLRSVEKSLETKVRLSASPGARWSDRDRVGQRGLPVPRFHRRNPSCTSFNPRALVPISVTYC